MNGSSPNEGSVEVCVDERWTPVCASEQNDSAFAESICLALGFSEGKNRQRKQNWKNTCLTYYRSNAYIE